MSITAGDGLSISWVRSHRRSREIAELAGIPALFVREERRTLPGRYLAQARATRRLLRERRPSFIIVMQPPPFALAAVLGYARSTGAAVFGDLHSGTFFDPRWRWATSWVLRQLRRHGGAIVPNSDLEALATEAGVSTVVCHGRMSVQDHDHEACDQSALLDLGSAEYVFAPLSFARDEPVDALLDAARSRPSVTWVLTGEAPRALREAAPMNVRFVGFVSATSYRTLVHHASALLALTTQDSTMQSVGFEALASARPLVISDFPVLRDYFQGAAEYCTPGSEGIASAVDAVLGQRAEWEAHMRARRAAVIEAQSDVATSLHAWLTRMTSAT